MSEKSILITGCSSGIGYDAAHTLQKRGWRVFATCRQEKDCERLRGEGLESFTLDYADEASIKSAVAEVLERTGGTLDRAAFLAVEATDDDAQRASAIDVETQLLAAKAVLAAETLRIVNRAQAGDVKGALAQLKVAKMQARTLVATTDDPDVAQLARELSVLDEVIREAEKTRAKAHKARHKSKHKPGKGGPGSVGYAPAPFPNATQSIEGARSIKRSHSRAFNALH
ncbi:MAG: SDR family NAD(P)-dependent oxidoreductase [Rhizobiales bacterium]|nr:SDR family NAD(P)-dependent oxidoreductase [Hyphomicrobiales bacterium]